MYILSKVTQLVIGTGGTSATIVFIVEDGSGSDADLGTETSVPGGAELLFRLVHSCLFSCLSQDSDR